MNYEKVDDFEINRAVEKIWFETPILGEFNPCNNPSDAWPIIKDARISILPEVSNAGWYAEGRINHKDGKWRYPNCTNKNPLRAAMIVYLMMQESESKARNSA